MSEDGKGYIVPNPPQPYDSICIRVYVPNHRLYIAAFWGAYQFFTTWLAWARDPLRKGKEAAQLWKSAYDKARKEFELRKGNCDMAVTDIRLNPNNKCDLQVRYDGGDWTSVADLSDCNGCGGGSGGSLQFDGININQYNSCSNEFEPVGEPFNPVVKGIYDSLYSPDESGKCNGAANIAQWVKYVADNSLSIFSTVGIAGAAVSFIMGTLANIAGAGFLTESLIASLLAQFVEEGDLFADASDIDISTEMQNILFGFMDDDGTIREPNFTEAITTLYARRDEEAVDTAERVRWGHEVNILSALGPYVISRQNKYAGIDDADCSAAGWTHVFDFTTGKHGWVASEAGPAEYQTGVGWKSTLFTELSGNTDRVAAIKTALPARTITRLKVYYTSVLGINDTSDPVEYRKGGWYKNEATAPNVVDSVDVEEGTIVYQWTGSEASVSNIIPAFVVGHDDEAPIGDPGGTFIISKIAVSGDGTDPF